MLPPIFNEKELPSNLNRTPVSSNTIPVSPNTSSANVGRQASELPSFLNRNKQFTQNQNTNQSNNQQNQNVPSGDLGQLFQDITAERQNSTANNNQPVVNNANTPAANVNPISPISNSIGNNNTIKNAKTNGEQVIGLIHKLVDKGLLK